MHSTKGQGRLTHQVSVPKTHPNYQRTAERSICEARVEDPKQRHLRQVNDFRTFVASIVT